MNENTVSLIVGAIGGITAALAAIYATRSSSKASARRVDAESYVAARAIDDGVVERLQGEINRLQRDRDQDREELDDVQRQLGRCIQIMLEHGIPIPDRS